MFTGLVEATGELRSIGHQGGGARLRVAVRWPDRALAATRIGDSVAVNGACLTVVAIEAEGGLESLAFDLSHETLGLTCFGDLQTGDSVNLERALRVGDRLGGHIVSGHVDALGTLVERVAHGSAWDLTYAVPPGLEPEIVVKGSIAVDGVSLTVNTTPPGRFSVTIIPHTSDATQLLRGGVGKRVHLETDVLAKHVRRLLQFGAAAAPARDISIDLLEKTGFL